ncbi:putative nuclease HARBI1 [Pleurodeles waltl]|uniref:putative nuclease HARBI1 n=1 Tax=Pleurodeles waltl TaxID=8319 RepID=UPI003709816D
MDEKHIMMTYRLNCLTIRELVAHLEPDLLPSLRHLHAITPAAQVLSVLHFVPSGSFQVTLGLAARISQLMFSMVLQDVLGALLKHINRYLRFPQLPDLNTVKAAFYNISNVPHVIGAVDGTHLALGPLRAKEQVYRNQNSTYSINVQMVRLADQYIPHVTVKFPGSVHDSCILRNSSVSALMLQLQRERTWLIGDSGYPNLPWLLTPVRYPTMDREDRYNEAHGQTRQVIEKTLSLLKARFCCLHVSGGALQYRPRKVYKIIVACCMLHYLPVRRRIPLLEGGHSRKSCG